MNQKENSQNFDSSKKSEKENAQPIKDLGVFGKNSGEKRSREESGLNLPLNES